MNLKIKVDNTSTMIQHSYGQRQTWLDVGECDIWNSMI